MKIGRIMKKLREINNLTQEQMAEKLHMSTQGYALIEHDNGNPNLPKIEKIAKVFDMTTLEFLDFCENGATFYIAGDTQQTNHNGDGNSYYICGKQGHELLLAQLEQAKLTIKHKDELLAQQKREIETLHELIAALKK